MLIVAAGDDQLVPAGPDALRGLLHRLQRQAQKWSTWTPDTEWSRDDKSTAPRRMSNPWSSRGLTQPTTTSSMREVSSPLRPFNTSSSPAPSASAWSRLARRPHCRSLEAFGCASYALCQELGMALMGRSCARARAVAVATVWRAKKASGSPPTSRANPAAKCGSIAATAAHPSTRR